MPREDMKEMLELTEVAAERRIRQATLEEVQTHVLRLLVLRPPPTLFREQLQKWLAEQIEAAKGESWWS